MTKKMLTTAQVADRIAMSERYVTQICAAGELPAKKFGNTWRIDPDVLEAFIADAEPVAGIENRTLTPKQRKAVAQRRRTT